MISAMTLQTKDVWWISWDCAGNGIQDELHFDRETADERIAEIVTSDNYIANSLSLREVTEVRQINLDHVPDHSVARHNLKQEAS